MIEPFDYYDTMERIKTCLADAESRKRINCRRLTREERRARRYRRTYIAAVLIWAMFRRVRLTVKAVYEEKEIPATAQEITATEAVESEDFENAKIETALLTKAHKIENCMVTHYAACVECCGNDLGITASGRKAAPYVSVGVDPCVIPLGSDVLVDYGDGNIQYYRADDTGSGVTGAHIDLCVENYQTAKELGVKTATVYYIPPVEVDVN